LEQLPPTCPGQGSEMAKAVGRSCCYFWKLSINIPFLPIFVSLSTTMAGQKTTVKLHNKKLKRRREGLSGKSYEYGELDGVELALFIRYPKRKDAYVYMSKAQLPWLRDVDSLVIVAPHPPQ
jgi:hypothetical protein